MNFKKNPIEPLVYTQKFGENSGYYKKYTMAGHNGVDLRTRFSDTPKGRREVYAVMDGKVTIAQEIDGGGYGKWIRITHVDGSETVYAHLHSLKVALGQDVKGGNIIGISDNTGDSSAPHLHFGYRLKGFNPNNGYKGYTDPEPHFT